MKTVENIFKFINFLQKIQLMNVDEGEYKLTF